MSVGPQALYPAIPKLEPPVSVVHAGTKMAYRYRFPRWADRAIRPGVCGEWSARIAVCSSDATQITFRKHCGDPSCPVGGCFEGWCAQQAEHMEDRMIDAVKAHRGGECRHYALSVPEAKAKGMDHKALLAEAKTVAMGEMGLKGGVLVYHRWRCQKGAQRRVSPHVHVIGWGWARPSDVVYAQTGWIYKNIDAEIKAQMEEPATFRRDIAATLRYLLTHAPLIYATGAEGNRLSAVRWMGGASSQSMARDGEYPLYEAVPCPLCQGDMMAWWGQASTGELTKPKLDEAGQHVIFKRWRLRRRWKRRVDQRTLDDN